MIYYNFSLQELGRRIRSLPYSGRPIPNTNDLKILGHELKIRLAANSPVLTEEESKSGEVRIIESWPAERYVTINDIDENQDSIVLCSMKLRTRNQGR